MRRTPCLICAVCNEARKQAKTLAAAAINRNNTPHYQIVMCATPAGSSSGRVATRAPIRLCHTCLK